MARSSGAGCCASAHRAAARTRSSNPADDSASGASNGSASATSVNSATVRLTACAAVDVSSTSARSAPLRIPSASSGARSGPLRSSRLAALADKGGAEADQRGANPSLRGAQRDDSISPTSRAVYPSKPARTTARHCSSGSCASAARSRVGVVAELREIVGQPLARLGVELEQVVGSNATGRRTRTASIEGCA